MAFLPFEQRLTRFTPILNPRPSISMVDVSMLQQLEVVLLRGFGKSGSLVGLYKSTG